MPLKSCHHDRYYKKDEMLDNKSILIKVWNTHFLNDDTLQSIQLLKNSKITVIFLTNNVAEFCDSLAIVPPFDRILEDLQVFQILTFYVGSGHLVPFCLDQLTNYAKPVILPTTLPGFVFITILPHWPSHFCFIRWIIEIRVIRILLQNHWL